MLVNENTHWKSKPAEDKKNSMASVNIHWKTKPAKDENDNNVISGNTHWNTKSVKDENLLVNENTHRKARAAKDKKTVVSGIKRRKEKSLEDWSVLLYDAIKSEATKLPFIMRCVLLFDTFYNVTIQKIYNKYLSTDKEANIQRWAERSGSYPEGTCIAGSDIDFVQPSIAMVHTCPENIPPWHRHGLIVYTEDESIPPGYCWLLNHDTAAKDVPRLKNGLEWYLYKGNMFRRSVVNCMAKEIDGHTHLPYRSKIYKVICLSAAYVQHSDGNVYFSQARYAKYLQERGGMTVSKSFNKWFPTWLSNGPAFTQTYFKNLSIDLVMSMSSESWPACAREWETRTRKYQWPTKELIQDIVNSGFEVVPIPSKVTLTSDADLEWRLSFRTAELKLVQSFNDCQRYCFIGLKLIVKQVVKPKYPDEDFLSSYIMKTVVFWLVEETHVSFWRKENFTHCFRLCLDKLKICLEKGFCPSYFIPEYNLFRTKLDRMFILGFREWMVKCIQENDWRIILLCSTLRKRFMKE